MSLKVEDSFLKFIQYFCLDKYEKVSKLSEARNGD